MSIRVVKDMLLDVCIRGDMSYDEAVTSSPPLFEQTVETYAFTVPNDGQVTFDITVPIVVFHYDNPGVWMNAACRLYLDGNGWWYPNGIKQWDSGIDEHGTPKGALLGAGQWNRDFAAPLNGRLSGTVTKTLSAGEHTLRVNLATSTATEKIRLMGPRYYQVSMLKVEEV